VALLAEPVSGGQGDGIDWYTRLPGAVRRLSELSPQEEADCRSRLGAIAVDLTVTADELKTDRDLHRQTIGRALETALRYPGDEHIFVVGDQPVLAAWGCAATSANAEPQSLTRLARAKVPAAASAGLPEMTNPAISVAPILVGQRRVGWSLPRWLPWSLLGLLIAMVLMLGLLRGCEPLTEVLAQEHGHELELRSQLAAAQAKLTERRRICPPPRQAARSEIDRRVSARGGQDGEATFRLAWNDTNDLDLRVHGPSGEVVWFGDKQSASGGKLDVDSNNGTPTSQPVENIVWQAPAPRGTYKVFVIFYNLRERAVSPFSVQVKLGGNVRDLSGSIQYIRNWRSALIGAESKNDPVTTGSGAIFIGSFDLI
jgi:hypothetical protein